MALELLKPIQKRSAEAQATDALREQILRGGARPGSRLTEIGLSQQLGLSRSTIRTALQRLANEGLVVEGQQMIEAALDALVQACRTGDRVAIADQDLGFHGTIVELSGHRRLRDHYRLVRQQIRLYIAWSDAIMPDVDAIIETHRWLADAILQRDADRATTLARDHCESAGRILAEFLGERGDAGGDSVLSKSK
jgi:DNA-binding GntR family transcriptional regulator